MTIPFILKRKLLDEGGSVSEEPFFGQAGTCTSCNNGNFSLHT